MEKQKRVVVYIGEREYLQLKSLLALSGRSVSGWFRDMVKKLITAYEEKE